MLMVPGDLGIVLRAGLREFYSFPDLAGFPQFVAQAKFREAVTRLQRDPTPGQVEYLRVSGIEIPQGSDFESDNIHVVGSQAYRLIE